MAETKQQTNADHLGPEAAAMMDALYRHLDALAPPTEAGAKYISGYRAALSDCRAVLIAGVVAALGEHRAAGQVA
jgi:hypothetical protein